MTPCRAGTCLLLIALWVSACGGAHAADRCQPRAALAAESPLEVRLDDPGTVVWLEGRLTNALTLPVSPSTFGIRSDESQVLAHDVLVRGQPVGRGALRDDRAALKTDDARGSLWLRFGSQRFVAKVVDHVAQSADGVPLQVSPNLDGEADFDVAQGARVKALGSGEVLIEPGATLRWRPQADRPLKMFLLNATRLSETSPSDTGISGELTPSKAPANAKFTIALNAGGLDLRAHPPTICFAGRSVVAAEDVRFVRQDGDIATIEMRLSREVAAELVRDASWWQRVRGVPAQVRAVAYVDNRPVVDVWLPLRVTSAPWSAAVGVAMLLLVYLTCAVLMRKANPIAIAGGLIQESSGRFSLSNLQVLLWSLLVLFALTFSWASSGQLLTLSASVLGLLGIAGGSSVLSRTVDRMDKAAAPIAAAPVEPAKEDLVNDKKDRFDLLRFQMLGFTVFSLLYALWSVLRSDGLPDLPESLYWLMGISNMTYVGGKAAGLVGTTTSAASDASSSTDPRTTAERELAPDRIKRLQQALGVTATGELDAATRAAITRYKMSNSLYPVNGRVNEPLLARLGA